MNNQTLKELINNLWLNIKEPVVQSEKIYLENIPTSITFFENDLYVNYVIQLLAYPLLLSFIGICGIITNRNNIFVSLLFIELFYIGIISQTILLASISQDYIYGRFSSLYLLVIAAAETALGLSLVILTKKFGNTLEFIDLNDLKG